MNSPTFDTSNLKIGSQLWATDVPNHFYGLRKFSQKLPIETIRKHVSSTVWWSGLGLSYDDLSEEQSKAHQLKYAILKTLIFKKAQNLKIFKIKWNLTILQLRFCILMAKFGIPIKFWSRNIFDDVCMMTFQKCHFLSRIVTMISNCVCTYCQSSIVIRAVLFFLYYLLWVDS